MRKPISEAIKGKFKSKDDVARALIKAHPDLNWPAERSLGTEIGKLDKGEIRWWMRRLPEAQALAALLELDIADLSLHPGSDQLFHFADFPELPPLDPAREKFCRLGVAVDTGPVSPASRFGHSLSFWLEDTERHRGRWPEDDVSWLVVPSGTGGTVLFEELAASHRFEQLNVTTLSAAAPRLNKPGLFVVAVHADGGVDDLLALSRRHDDARVLVIAPFPAPSVAKASLADHDSWEYLSANKVDRKILSLANADGVFGDAIRSYHWELKENWKDLLLDWVEQRLNKHSIDTLFSASGLKIWLEQFDPSGEWIRTPKDMAALCRVSHRLPKAHLPRHSDRDAGARLLRAIMPLKPMQEAAFSKLAVARWSDIDLAWRAALPFSVWQTLHGGVVGSVSDSDLMEIADGPNQKARRQRAMQVAERMAHAELQSLIDAQLLVDDGKDAFELQPRSLADVVVRDHLVDQMVHGSHLSWAQGLFDEYRRRSIDATLDTLDVQELGMVAETVLKSEHWGAFEVGAAEALFCAGGRRLLAAQKVPESISGLVPIVLPHLGIENDFALPGPWSRALASDQEQLEWIAVCWAWSLSASSGGSSLPDSLAWLFPGWANTLPEPPGWLPIPTIDKGSKSSSASWKPILRLADNIVARWSTPVHDAPVCMHASLLAAAARGAWPAVSAWWTYVVSNGGLEEHLLSQMNTGGASAAVRLWPSWIRHESNPVNEIVGIHTFYSNIRVWMLSELTSEQILDLASGDELEYLARIAMSLPLGARLALASVLPLDTFDERYTEAPSFFRACSRAPLDSLARWLESSVGYAAANAMWEQSVDAVMAWIRSNVDLKPQLVEALIEQCPDECSALVTEFLHEHPLLLSPDRRREWARSRLPNAGAAAPRVFSLMTEKPKQPVRARPKASRRVVVR